MNYKSKIKQIRENKNFTQKELSEKLNINVSTLRNWENNRRILKHFRYVADLCNVLNCSPLDLYTEEE
ncbi:helix-turn-helix domain-containing protein [Geminocystis herdmanii]|uniref:helix-turn-helix domain-containing protein n=1 Tax=Geminocystis herdmanii TaxID=669359 RepID=UPI000347BC1F|nr:helix-turn-helix transcriptional regulator [Geminocystis herdmanii]